MNIINKIKEAQSGVLKGAVTSLSMINREIGGIYPGMYGVIASEQKVGKSTFVYEYFVASLLELNPDIDIEINIVSTEMPRDAFEAKLISRFLYTTLGKYVSTQKLLGRELSSDNKRVFLTKEEMYEVEKVYEENIKPITGEYDNDGKLIHKGKINWLTPLKPDDMFSKLRAIALENGVLLERPVYGENLAFLGNETVSYKPHDPNKIIINIIDHIRQLPKPNGVSMKDNVDNMSKYLVRSMNEYKHVNIAVVHLNRWFDSTKLRSVGDRLMPTSDNIKDTGNLSEDVSFMITLMDPSDVAYNINRHFGYDFKAFNEQNPFLRYRSAHLVENRYGGLDNARLGYIGAASHFYEIK